MTGLAAAAPSVVLGGAITGSGSSFAAAGASLALAVFRGHRGRGGGDDPFLHGPPHRRGRQGWRSEKTEPRARDTAGSNGNNHRNPLVGVYHAWLHLPQVFRFFVAGNLGNLGFFYLEKVFFQCLSHILIASTEVYSFLLDGIEKYQDGLSFFSAYLVQIVTTHLLYAFLVYGMDTIDTYEKYCLTLWGQFKVYGFGLVGATGLNSFLIGRGFEKFAAFWITTASFAVINYVLVSRVVSGVVEASEAAPPGDAGASPGPWGKRRKQKQRQRKFLGFAERVGRGGGRHPQPPVAASAPLATASGLLGCPGEVCSYCYSSYRE